MIPVPPLSLLLFPEPTVVLTVVPGPTVVQVLFKDSSVVLLLLLTQKNIVQPLTFGYSTRFTPVLFKTRTLDY